MTINRIPFRKGAAAFAFAAVLLLCAPAFPPVRAARAQPAAGAAAVEGVPDIRIAFSMDAYWYAPGSTATLKVTLANDTRQTIRDIRVRARVHTPNTGREDLDASFDNKLKKTYRTTVTFDQSLELKPGDNAFAFQLELPSSRYSDGVYPITVEAFKEDTVYATAISQLVVMSPDTVSENPRLRLAIVFDTLQPSNRDPEGDYTGSELSSQCNPSGSTPGWLSTLTTEIEKWESFHLNLSLSPLLLEELDGMTGGYTAKKGEKKTKVASNSREAANASTIIGSFMRIAQVPTVQSLPAPYASPNLETLISFGWKDDATEQMSHGRETLERVLDQPLSRECIYPPAGILDDASIKTLKKQLGRYLVLSPAVLDRTREGKRLLRGDTLARPVVLSGESGTEDSTALFTDARLEQLAGRLSNSGDVYGVTQAVVSELTNLYLEKPESKRACVFLWPGWWQPPQAVLDELLRGLSATPWIQGSTVTECIHAVPAIENSGVTLPGPGKTEPDEYFKEVQRARQHLDTYSSIVERDNPTPELMQRDVYISESDAWRQWDRAVQGLSFAGWVIRATEDALDKIDLPAVGSITLAGGTAKVPISVVNGTGYPVKAVLKLASNGLEFPDGSTMKVKLEPKENLFEIPVTVKKKGRVRFTARLEAGNMVVGEIDFTVLTSRFNTFAVAVVGGLLALIGAVWAWRLRGRWHSGKHKSGNVPAQQEGDGEEESGESGPGDGPADEEG